MNYYQIQFIITYFLNIFTQIQKLVSYRSILIRIFKNSFFFNFRLKFFQIERNIKILYIISLRISIFFSAPNQIEFGLSEE